MWLITTLLFLIILGILAYFDAKKPKNFPPGPKWLPILGSALVVHKYRKKFGTLVDATAKLSEKYGPVLGLRVGKDRTVIVLGAEAMREFLSKEDLAGRPQGIFYEMRTWGKRRGVLLTDEDLWIEQRRFVLRHLREFGYGKKNMSNLIEEEAFIMVSGIRDKVLENNGRLELRIDDMFGIPVLNTLWNMMAGVRYSPEDKNMRKLQKILTALFTNIDMAGALFSQFPLLRHIAPEFSGYTQYLETHRHIWKFLNDELNNHKATYNPDNIRDFMDVYLTMLNLPDQKEHFSEAQLLAICLDLFMAGSETTTKSLGFCFLYLILNPDVIKKVQEEVDLVVGHERLPTLNDRPNMKYTECVVLETLRMFMSHAFNVPHRALRDTTLAGYFIPKDTMVLANMQGVLMGPECGWDNPNEFVPERFIKDDRIYTPPTFLPFGFGRHRCMGETLAKANIFLLVSSLLQAFNFSLPPGRPLPSTNAVDGVTPGPFPFKAIITLRE